MSTDRDGSGPSQEARLAADFVLLETLARLTVELRHTQQGLTSLAADPTAITSSRMSLRRALQLVRELQEYALSAVRDKESGEVRARALRSRGVLVALHLSDLERAARGVSFADLPGATFLDARAFADHVLQSVGRINARWCIQYSMVVPRAHRAAVQIIEAAEADYAAIGRQPVVERFLTWGLASPSGSFRSACRVVAVLLGRGLPQPNEVPELPALALQEVPLVRRTEGEHNNGDRVDSAAEVTENGTKGRLLIVDENELVRRWLSRAFSRRGYECCAVETVEAALSAVDTFEPQFVIMEPLFSDTRQVATGLATRLRVRALARGRRLRIVILSGVGDGQGTREHEDVDAYFTKPVRLELIDAVFATTPAT